MKKVVDKIKIEILNHNYDGWFIFHDVVEAGCVYCFNLFVHFAHSHHIDILDCWNQKITFHRKKTTNMCSHPPDYERLKQISFLAIVAINNNSKIIDYLAPLYVEKNRFDNGVSEAIYYSVLNPKILQQLLSYFSEHFNTTKRCYDLLSFVIRGGPIESVKTVLKCVNNFDKTNVLPVICFAVERSYKNKTTNFLKVLIEAGLSFRSTKLCDKEISIFENFFRLPLLFAVKLGSLEIVKFLVENGADLYAAESCFMSFSRSTQFSYHKFRATAIFLAAFRCKTEILEYLITVTDQELLGMNGLTSPVVACVIRCFPKPLKLLLEAGYRADGLLSENFSPDRFYFWGNRMLDNVTNVMDDSSDHDRPVLSCLKTLFSCGVKFTDWTESFLLIEFLFYPESVAFETLQLYVKAGLLEYLFGKTFCITKLKYFLRNECWNIIKESSQWFIPRPVHSKLPWIGSRDNTCFYVDRLNIILNHINLFEKVDVNTMELNETCPMLSDLCRYVIRSSVIKYDKSLYLLDKLPLPLSLIMYLKYEV